MADTALDVLKALFKQYGLEDLATTVVNFQTDPKYRQEDGKTLDEVKLVEDLREQPSYKTRFAAKLARDAAIQKASQAGQFTTMQPISEADQLKLEQDYKKLAVEAGLPAGFYDNPQDFTNLIVNDVSVDEYSTRIDMAQQAALQSNAALKQQLQQQYGLAEQDLTAFYLDADRARAVTAAKTNDLVRQFNQAALQQAGFEAGTAAQVAQQSVPVDVNASYLQQQGQALIGLTKETVGGEAAQLTQEQLANVLTVQSMPKGSASLDYMSQQALQDALARQKAKYQTGGQIATTAQGVIGLTQANL